MISDLSKVWALFTPPERRNAKWILLLIVLLAASETASVLSIMPFLSVLSRPSIVEETPWLHAIYVRLGFHNPRDFVFALGLGSIALVVVSSAFKTVAQHIFNRFIHMERHSISARLLSRYLHQPYEFFLSKNSAVLAKNVLAEVDHVIFDLIHPLSQLIAQGAVVLAMAVLIFAYDPKTALFLLTIISVLYAVIYGLVRQRLALIGREREIANAQRHQACHEVLAGIKDVKVTHAARAYLGTFERASRLFSRHMSANETLAQSPLYMVEAVGYSGLIVVALLLLLRTNDVAHVLPALGLYGFASYRILPAAQIIYRGVAKLKASSAALNLIHHDLSLAEEEQRPASTALTLRSDIRLDGIRYAYPAAPATPVFEDFTLIIPANSSIGIAGRSGAGKSTLMDLLLGLLRPQAGSLSVDGIPVTTEKIAAWQRAIGYVPQHIYLADTTLAENIAFGVPTPDIDMEAVQRAARAAQIHDYIMKLPERYDTNVGERGIRLSGGQRQRIGVARALYRDPPVLFFDEATSALDVQTEEALNEAIRALSGSKTIIVIAHKEASLRHCQQVITIGDNKPRAASKQEETR